MAGTAEVCLSCKRKYRSCTCKHCGLCGTQFHTAVGFVRQRSHCRTCGNAICSHCYTSGGRKICNVCRREQKKATLQMRQRLSMRLDTEDDSNDGNGGGGDDDDDDDDNDDDSDGVTGKQRRSFLGRGGGGRDLMPDDMASVAASLSVAQKRSLLVKAAKQGDHHVIVTLLEAGSDVDSADAIGNTSLICAAERAHLACLVLLLERGANIQARNNLGWTALHALARNAGTVNHVECLDYLIQMGSDVFAEDDEHRTPYDVACKFSRISDVIDCLGVAQARRAIDNLKACVASGSFSNLKRRQDIEKWIEALVRMRSNTLFKENDATASNNLQHHSFASPSRETDSQPSSLSDVIEDKKSKSRSTEILNAAEADHVDRTIEAGERDRKMISELALKVEELSRKNDEVETQCRTLVQTIGKITAAHQKEKQQWNESMTTLSREKEITVKKTEAMYLNRIAKIEEDSRRFLEKAKRQIEEMDMERCDLLHLQQNFNLTWVPDELVHFCANSKCSKAFTATRRRHHCRCCGRVFCSGCSGHQAAIPALGYDRVVRVCNTCYALVDDLVSAVPIRERPEGESTDGEESDVGGESFEQSGLYRSQRNLKAGASN